MSGSAELSDGADRPQAEGPSRWRRFVAGWGRWRWRCLLLLAPGAVLYGLFVAQDEPALSTGPALLIDNLLRAASLLALASVVVLAIAREDLARWASAVASLTVLVLGGAVVMSGLWSSRRDLPVVALAVLATVSAGINLWVHRDSRAGVKTRMSKGLAALLAIAAVPAFNFWAETSYLPSRSSATLVGSVEVAPERAPDGSLHLVVSSRLENTSQITARVLMSSLAVCSAANENDLYASFDAEKAELSTCAFPPAPFDYASSIDPKGISTVRRSVALGAGQPFTQVRLQWWYARADRLVLAPAVELAGRELGECAWAERQEIRAQSRLSSLALQDQSVVYADVHGDKTLYYRFRPSNRITCDEGYSWTPLEQYFAVTWDSTVWAGWPAAAATTDQAGSTPPG